MKARSYAEATLRRFLVKRRLKCALGQEITADFFALAAALPENNKLKRARPNQAAAPAWFHIAQACRARGLCGSSAGCCGIPDPTRHMSLPARSQVIWSCCIDRFMSFRPQASKWLSPILPVAAPRLSAARIPTSRPPISRSCRKARPI